MLLEIQIITLANVADGYDDNNNDTHAIPHLHFDGCNDNLTTLADMVVISMTVLPHLLCSSCLQFACVLASSPLSQSLVTIVTIFASTEFTN